MKQYVKPTIEIIELRPEERLATCGVTYKKPSMMLNWLYMLLGWRPRCKSVFNGSCQSS